MSGQKRRPGKTKTAFKWLSSNSKYANNVIRKVTASGEEEISFYCEYCNKIFKSLQGLMYHRPIHTGEWTYRCEYEDCGRGFVKSRDYYTHLKLKHND